MNININDYLNASEIILINFFTEYNIKRNNYNIYLYYNNV